MKVILFVLSLIIISTYCTIEHLETVPREWSYKGEADVNEIVSFTFALKEENLDELHRISEAISNPNSPQYRQFKTMEELQKLTAPSKENLQPFLDWLNNLDGITYEYQHTFIIITGTIGDINRHFNTHYYQFEHFLNPWVISRSIQHPSIPEEFYNVVLFSTGAATFPYPRKEKFMYPELYFEQLQKASKAGSDYVVPQTLRAQYNIPSTVNATNSDASQAVVEFSFASGVSVPDLQKFMTLTGGNPNANLTGAVGNFDFFPVDPVNVEATLDVQYIMGMAPGIPTYFWNVDGWIYDFTTLALQRQSNGQLVPNIFSISYGWAEGDQCSITGAGTGCNQLGGTSASYVQACDSNFEKMGAAGVTVFVASGDAGAATKENINCRNKRTPIQPDYPASSPHITCVGGTMFQEADPLGGTLPPFCTEPGISCYGAGVEVVCSCGDALITSGGGFSNVFDTPSWQQTQVTAWLNSKATQPPADDFNSKGRAYPDITALAHAYMIVYNGDSTAVDGTSASSPSNAAIFSLILDDLLNSGSAPVGFINPTLYSLSSGAFNDVTSGNNEDTEAHGLGDSQCCKTPGYGAAAGFDPVSGLGSINFPNMLAGFQSASKRV